MRQEEMKRSPRRRKPESATPRHKAPLYTLGKNVRDHTPVLDAMLDGYFLVDSEGKFLQVNEAFSEMIGYSTDELLTMSVADVEVRETPEEICHHIARVMAAGKERFTTLHRHKNGSILCLQISALLSENGTQLHAFVRDDTSRTAAERALRSSEAKFATAFHLAPDVLAISQLRNGQFVDVNAAFERASGHSRAEVIGKSSLDLELWVDPGQREAIMRELQRDGQVREKAFTFRTRDGVIREGRMSAEPIEIDGVECIISVIQDVTEQQELQRALQFQSLVLDTISQPVIVTDLNGVITYWNQAATDLYGWTAEETIGRPSVDLYQPDMKRLDPENVLRETVEKGCWRGEVFLKGRDGSPINVLVATSALTPGLTGETSIVSIATNVTEMRRQEEVLRESEKWYRELFERSVDPICVVSMDGVILDVNPAACQIICVSREQLIGSHVEAILGPELQGFLKVVDEKLGKGEGVFDWTFPSASGHDPVYEISVRHFQFKGQKAILAVGRNISLRQEAEQRLKNTVAEKEVLLQETHHRVKNNLQIIASLLNLRKSGIKDPVALGMIDQSRHRIELMASVYEQVYQSKNLAHIDFAEFLRRSVHDLVESMRHEHVHIDVRFVLDEIKLNLQPAIYLGIVIHELVSNAMKHAFIGRAEGTIEVTLQRGAYGDFTLAVADDGVGVPTDLDTETSASLGLRLVNALIRQLGGNAAVQTSHGTRWTVTFAVGPV